MSDTFEQTADGRFIAEDEDEARGLMATSLAWVRRSDLTAADRAAELALIPTPQAKTPTPPKLRPSSAFERVSALTDADVAPYWARIEAAMRSAALKPMGRARDHQRHLAQVVRAEMFDLGIPFAFSTSYTGGEPPSVEAFALAERARLRREDPAGLTRDGASARQFELVSDALRAGEEAAAQRAQQAADDTAASEAASAANLARFRGFSADDLRAVRAAFGVPISTASPRPTPPH